MRIRLAALSDTTGSARSRAQRLWVCLSVLAAAFLTVPGWALATTPGRPGVPQAPTTAYFENFENGVGTAPVLLTDYTGASGEKYTADPAWLTDCNGDIVEFESTGPSNCSNSAGYAFIRQLAWALGKSAGSTDPTTNHGVASLTLNTSPGANKVQFQTLQPIPLIATNRFITFSVEAAHVACTSFPAHAQLMFYLLEGSTAIPTFTTPIDPCTDPKATVVTVPASSPNGPQNAWVGNYPSNSAVLFSGSSIGIRMINGQGSSAGNDAAFDDIRILDATPQLDKSFAPAVVNAGDSSTLTFTITNTTDLAAKAGWSFTDRLPAGLTVAGSPNVSTTCSGGSVTAPAGGSSVAVTGNLNAGQASCTVSVDVTSPDAGTFTDGPANVSLVGLNAPGSDSVRFLAADLAITKTPSLSTVEPGGQVSYVLTVNNNGPSDASDVTVSDPLHPALGLVSAIPSQGDCGGGAVVRCDLGGVPAGGSAQILVTARVASGASGPVENTATVLGANPDPDPANNRATARIAVTPPAPPPPPPPAQPVSGLVIVKRVSRATAYPGQRLTYTVKVTNHGPDPATDVRVTDTASLPLQLHSVRPSQGACQPAHPLTCTLGTLEVGRSATIKVVAAVRRAGTQRNSASAVSASADPNTANNLSRTKTTIRPVLRLRKTAAPRTARAGQTIRYRLRLTNPTSVAIHHVTVCDRLPARLRFIAASPHARLSHHKRCWTINTLHAHRAKRYTLLAAARPGASGRLVNRATASARHATDATARSTVRLLTAPPSVTG